MPIRLCFQSKQSSAASVIASVTKDTSVKNTNIKDPKPQFRWLRWLRRLLSILTMILLACLWVLLIAKPAIAASQLTPDRHCKFPPIQHILQ